MDKQDRLKKYAILSLVVQHEKELAEQYKSEKSDHIDHLKNLPLMCKDGKLRFPNECVYVECGEKEPFTYISLPNQVVCQMDERNLVKQIVERAGGKCVNDIMQWQQVKIDQYIQLQEINSVEDIHYQFINELAAIQPPSSLYPPQSQPLKLGGIKLLDRNGAYCMPSELTLGSSYKPKFDFETCKITILNYLSDTYRQNCSNPIGKVFRSLGVHYDFLESDIPLLEDRNCAVYFWTTYLQSGANVVENVKKLIDAKKLDSVKCIPTQTSVMQPNQLYYGEDVAWTISYIENGEDKFPSRDLPVCKLQDNEKTLFELLPMRKSLDFLDSLYALLTVPAKHCKERLKLLRWIVDSYKNDEKPKIDITGYGNTKDFYDAKLEEYKKDTGALWLNGKSEPIHISKLYALAIADKSYLSQYFGSHELVISTKSMPDNEEYYLKVCELFKIEQIHKNDLDTQPTMLEKLDQKGYDELILCALFIAGFESFEKWNDLFTIYKDKLGKVNFYACNAIEFYYKNNKDISQSRKKFFTKDDSEVFYKKTPQGFRDGQIFLDFLKHLKKNILETKLDEDSVSDILHSKLTAVELLINHHVQLLHDMEFVDTLLKYAPDFGGVIKPYLPEIETSEEKDVYRPTIFTTRAEEANGDNINIVDGERKTQEEDSNSKKENKNDTIKAEPNLEPQDKFPPENLEVPIVGHDGVDLGSIDDDPILPSPRGSYDSSTTMSDYNHRNSLGKLKQPYTPDPDGVKSSGMPIQLETAQITQAEEADLRRILNGKSSEDIANDAYLANYRLLKQIEKWKEEHPEYNIELEESEADFMLNIPKKGGVVADHKLKSGKFIRSCSAPGGVLYLSPGVWNLVADERCMLCIFRGADNGRVANEFKLIRSYNELIEFIGMDDLVIKLTGKYRVKLIEFLYKNIRSKVTRGTVYSLIRVAETTPIDSITAPVPVAMQEQEDEDSKFY